MASSGAQTPGVDGIDKPKLAPALDEEPCRIRAELLAGTYQPATAQRVFIPEANGKQRPLEIPTLRDQTVCSMSLMRTWRDGT